MPAFDECIKAKAAEGVVSKSKATKLARDFRKRADDLAKERGIPLEQAEQQIGERMFREEIRELERRKRSRAANARTQARMKADAEKYGKENTVYGVYSRGPNEKYRGLSVEGQTKAIRGIAHSKMADFIDAYRTRTAGLTQRVEGIRDVVRVLHGEKVDNEAAMAIGGGVKEALEYLRQRFNAAGGDIVERQDWGIFHRWDGRTVAAADRNTWRQDMMNNMGKAIDDGRVLDENGNPMTRSQVWAALGESYDSIATRGVNESIENLAPASALSSVNKRANSRFIVFDDAEAWMRMHDKYGKGSLYDLIVASTDALARDTAILETLGPYPVATLRMHERLLDEAAAEGALSRTGKAAGKAAAKIGRPKAYLHSLYATSTGRLGIPDNPTAAGYVKDFRNLITSSRLGAAFISAISDIGFQTVTARLSGMPVGRVWGRSFKTFITNPRKSRVQAIRAGLTAQGAVSRALGAQRILGEIAGSGWSEKVSDTVLRASLLTPWTEAGRYGTGMEMMGFVADQFEFAWGELPDLLRNTFSKYGIGPEDWEAIRATPLYDEPLSGATMLRFEDIAKGTFEGVDFDAMRKLQEMVFGEIDFAIPVATDRITAGMRGGLPPGTFWGEVIASATMFKSFPVSVVYMHFNRFMAQADPKTKAEYAAWLVLGTTALGAVGEQVSNISQGKDPRDMATPEFWVDAFVRAGSGGIVADLLFQDQVRYGRSLTDSLVGPAFQTVGDAFELTVGNVHELLRGEDTEFGRELYKFVRNNLPGRSVWYSALAFERIVLDQLRKALDPKAYKAFRDIERRVQEEDGQSFWAPPGSGFRRGPDLDAIVGE